MLIDKRWISSVQQCRSFQGADIESGHSLVIGKYGTQVEEDSQPAL